MINLQDFSRVRQAINNLQKAFYNIEGAKIISKEKGFSEEETLAMLEALSVYVKHQQQGLDELLRKISSDLEAHSQHTELFSGEIYVFPEEELSHDPLGLIAVNAIKDQA